MFKEVMNLILVIIELILFIGGVIWIFKVGPDLWLSDPIYTLLVIVFLLISIHISLMVNRDDLPRH